LSFDGIAAHADDNDAKLVELLFCVTKLGRFYRSTGSVGFWIEEQYDAFASKVREGDVVAGIVLQTECRNFVADFQHVHLGGHLRGETTRGFDQ
jgi:hypothetical protein